jgi:hypothetical protein
VSDLLCRHLPSVCGSIPFGDESFWSVDNERLLSWLSGGVEKLLPFFERGNGQKRPLSVELGRGTVRYFIRPDLGQQLKDHLR